MNESDSIKALEDQAKNTRHLIDKLNRAAYGMTFDEALKIGGKAEKPDEKGSADDE